jgi:Acetyltransferase (GNAT) family
MDKNNIEYILMKIYWEELIVLLNDGLPKLVEQHWNESGLAGRKLDVDWTRYAMLEKQNVIRWLGVREEGNLVGYASLCITHPLHHKKDKNALLDTIYLSKEARKGTAGAQIIDAIEAMLLEEGVDLFTVFERTRLNKNGICFGDILRRKGFQQHETGWIKTLGV